MPLEILVVDDDPLAQKVLAAQLSGHVVHAAPDLKSALDRLQAGRFDVCFIDLKLGPADRDCSGLKVIPVAAAKGAYSVVMSGHDSEEYVEKAYALGCDDFYAKGNETTNVAAVLDRFRLRALEQQKDRVFSERFVTEDAGMRAAIAEALKYAASDIPVMLLGPSGSGKTSLARVLHDHSGRRGDFVALNCSAYTEDLLEAELFGYKRGAFTGATEHRRGKLSLADRGTLFLDEIGSMSPKMQTKLLKAIEEKSFYPLGSEKAESSDFRVVSATLEDLQALIRAGKLRFDFFQRVHGLTVTLKPLKDRPGDILPLAAHMTRGGKRLAFSPEAKQELLGYAWPGNARELKKVVELLAAGPGGRVSGDAVRRLLGGALSQEPAGFASDDQYRHALEHGLSEAADRFVDSIIRRCMAENGGKKTKVLEDLRISTRLLYASLKRKP